MACARKRQGYLLLVLLFALASARNAKAGPEQVALPGHVPGVMGGLTPKGRLAATNTLALAIGLPLRNEAVLNEFLQQLYDPHSTNFHRFLTPQEFTARFGPTEQDYQAVMRFAADNGFTIVGTYPNRVVLDVEGCASNVEPAFHTTLRTYRHPKEPRDFFAPDTPPSVPANLPVADVEGLSDFGRPHPLSHPTRPLTGKPLSGSGPSGWYMGNDFRNAYAPGTTLAGGGQAVGLLEFSDYYQVDITNYENIIGLTNYVPLKNVVVGHSTPSTADNDEVALDIEVAIAMAPKLSQVIVYEESSINPSSILNKMASDNLAKQLSSSWSWSGGPNSTVDAIFQQMAAQGQSFFQAAGDSDAYTGANSLDNSSVADAPVDSTNITVVGGTTLTMNGTGASWASETVWNYNSYGGSDANVGSSGGSSTYYTIPRWQTNMSMAANQGSTTFRNIPDVALTADGVFVDYNNGSSGGFAGTSCAAPLWAGFCALVNQQSMMSSNTTVGFLNPALYSIGTGANYAACFHDTTTGNNIGNNTPGYFYAAKGYDLCTGWGTPNGTNLINALAPAPYILTPPASQTATNGHNATFTVTAGGQPPFGYRWLFSGTNLPAGGNVSGTASNLLTITSVTPSNAGSYSVLVTNSYGSVTSAVATLTVALPPSFSTQPTNLVVVAGSNAVFGATVSGTLPLVYQWRQNATNLPSGGNVTGATSNVLSLTAITLTNAGNYTLVVTNVYGAGTSAVATLTVVLPATITIAPSAQTVQCGSNAVFSVTATGTPPLNYQWSLDGAPIPGATETGLWLTNVHLPTHTVAVVVTNAYGSATSAVALIVQDTLPPVITLNGSNPYYVELGSTFVDPGATAYDLCMGVVPVTITGTVNTNAVSTNTVTYTATDGNGNTNTATRIVLVRDTTPPTILWSFTNLVLAAGTNCTASMPNVTGTNYIVTTDLSGTLTLTQVPTNNVALPLGTNVVVITVADASGNASYSTNQIIVQDQTPPVIVLQPQSQTATVGASAGFSVAAVACTPLTFQWYFENTALAAQTNSTLGLSNLNTSAAGNYFAVVSASGGSTTSAVATLTVALPPSFSTQPTNPVVVAGENAVLSATVSGALPLVYQWRQNGTNLASGSNVTGATSNVLSLTAITLTNAGNYTLAVTNVYGAATSSVATLTVLLPPTITIAASAQTVQCGSNAVFSVTATGTPPLNYQWSLDGAPIAGATNTSLSLTNVHLPSHTVAVVVTNAYGSATSAVALIVQDTLPPVITLNGSNPYYVELGSTFVDPGATAYDLCMGVVPVTITGTVNTNAVSTNTVTYTATDGNGNTNTATRIVLVRDTTPPTILWSFTNLVLAAGTNCTASMPNVTGTNYIVTTDLSGTLTLTQVPTNNVALPLGTNVVVITVADASGNASYSTNQIIVQDQTPPVIVLQPQSQTATVGASAGFSVAAVACTPLTFQWYFENTVLAAQTNSTLGLSNLNTSAAGNYFAVVTASGGSATSSVATLTVLWPPTITVPPSAQTVQCASNAAFSVTATGAPPLDYQWSLDGAPIAGATDTSLSLTNVHLPSHTAAVVVTNLYGSATSAVVLTVQDTLPPVLTLNGSNPYYVELGSAFLDPGATAYDLCAGTVPVVATGTVNTNAVSTNTVTYAATDGNGNTNTATRTVLVRDTTPPTILWSFTNLVLAAGTNCTGAMPEVTGTNYILATDLSGTLTLTQVPTNNAALPLGTNVVVITVADASGNASYSTNQIIVQDQTPPVIVLQPQSQTATVGASAGFSVAAVACTPLTFQWYFENTALAAQTNSTLGLSNLNTSAAGNYFAVVSASGGSATSAVATLTVVLPATITIALSAQTVQCGSNAVFSVTATGTPPLNYQWSLDGAPIPGATNTGLWLTNVHLPTHTVAVVVTNAYGSATSAVALTVQDTLPPVITLNGSNPYYVELGSAFLDPGATAYDLCMGVVPVTITGTVNTNAVSTNTVTYTATDGNANTSTATRTVLVRDTTPPTILWSFTNLVLAAGTNCTASMPNVTGTNYILATDLAGTLTMTQVPTNNTALPLGTNVVVITVADAYGNTAYSTNQIIVQDQTPPVIVLQPQSQTDHCRCERRF